MGASDRHGPIATLEREGLRWWFEMDIPRLRAHLEEAGKALHRSRRLTLLEAATRTPIPLGRVSRLYAVLLEDGDLEGAAAAAGAAVASIWDSGRDFRRYRPWRTRIDALLRPGLAPLATASLLHFRGLIELTRRDVRGALAWFEAQRAAAQRAGSLALQVQFATSTVYALVWMGRFAEAEIVLADAEPMCTAAGPAIRAFFAATCGFFRYAAGDHDGARRTLETLVAQPNLTQLPPPAFLLGYGHLLLTCAAQGDQASVARLQRRLHERVVPENNHFHHAYLHYTLGTAELRLGRPEAAVLHAEEARRHAARTDSLIAASMAAMLRGQALADLGRDEEASRHWGTWIPRWQQAGLELLRGTAAAERAALLLRRGAVGAARATLADAERGAEPLRRAPPLNRGRERTATLRAQLFGERPPPDLRAFLSQHPVRIRTFGELLLEIGEDAVHDHRWRSRRARQLLVALIVCGGRKVSFARLADLLWPDTDGAAAENALKVTLSRLRRAGRDGRAEPLPWLVVRDKRVSLQRPLCAVDALLFQEGLAHSDEPARLRGALDLYRDDFLASDDSATWILGHRERLRRGFVRGAIALAAALRTRDRAEEALPYLERACRLDPLGEPVHAAFMESLLAAGYPAEAVRAHRRLAEALADALGTRPGPRLQALARRAEAAARHRPGAIPPVADDL